MSSRAWQLHRSQQLIEPHGGVLVGEYFDCGHSRSVPWQRRPAASRLLEALRDPDRGFAGVVIGEPQRAFYGNQFSLTFPIFTYFGVQLWVPEVGGPIDPGSEAHVVMTLFIGWPNCSAQPTSTTPARAWPLPARAIQPVTIGGPPSRCWSTASGRLDRYRAALEAGTDPAVVQQWIAEVTATRAAAQAQLRDSRTAPDGLTPEQVRALLEQAGRLVQALDRSDPALRAQLYEELGINGVYDPNRHTVEV